MKKIFLPFCLFILLLTACKTTDNTLSKNNNKKKIDKELLYGLWKVIAFRFEDGRVMVGEYMGFPQYEFRKDGQRIKTLMEEPSPPPETVGYTIKKDSVVYAAESKFPSMKIKKLTKDTLVLSNETLSWFLAR